MTFRQFLMACCVSVFSPMSRLLPHATVRIAGFSGWLAPVFAAPLLLLLLLVMRRLLTVEGKTVGLAEALERRLGRTPGRILTALLGVWLVFYGGFLLRSGAERLLSTVYHTGRLWFFLPALLCLSTVFAMGKLRWAGRSAAVSLMLTACALVLTSVLAIPGIQWEHVFPPDLTRSGEVLIAALPVADVLSPWVYFTLLWGRVKKESGTLRKSVSVLLIMLGATLLFIITTTGVMGAELTVRQQFPFFAMIKNLTLLDVMERFDALVLAIWMMTDYVCIGMTLLSASEAFCYAFSKKQKFHLAPACATIMLGIGAVISKDAFEFENISNVLIPAINTCMTFLLLPALSLLPEKNLKKMKNKC